MRKRISIAAAGLIVIIATIFVCGSYVTIRENKRKMNDLHRLPALPFYYIKEPIQSGENAVIVNYFSPECEHCQYMAGEISRHALSFRRSRFVMVTAAGAGTTNAFLRNYRLDTLPFLAVGLDTAHVFSGIFNTSVVPCFFIYDKQHRLREAIYGETKIERIYQAIDR